MNLSRLIAISIAMMAFPSLASTNEIYQARSINYIGFDSVNSFGQPICSTCEAEKLAEIEIQKALEERRQRARDFMARSQGQKIPGANSLDAAETVSVAVPVTGADQSTAAQLTVSEMPLRAALQ